MSNFSDPTSSDTFLDECGNESLKRMIYFTKRQAEKDGKTFCAYFLDMALNALADDSEEMNALVKSRVTPLPFPAAQAQKQAQNNV
ncbi:conserved hypothetical protein [Roseibium sp. TrichSKD4]|uniref:hypothetical protein n=1 Tax=Roseibium sp. TrichSKD4 TaxID=744980 RepID=UPI0001E56325|nr:hypothetical protein [Roseibium sp. TrichSKD4]EFO33877.1 conserved hypothetical protein [Roseibium sp. TrichSKD4]